MQEKAKKKWFKWIRWSVLLTLLSYVTYQSYMHQVLGGSSEGAPSIHALCPFGALESLQLWITRGVMVQRIYAGTFALLVIVVVMALLFRRSFCGLMCPFGALQELSNKWGVKFFKKKYTIPQKVDQPLRYLKYGMLFLTVGMAWYLGDLWMSPYDPWVAYGHLGAGWDELVSEMLIGVLLLGVTLFASLFYDRFFCKYLCPMGAFLGIVSKISPNVIKRDSDKCIDCGLCSRNCPVDIQVDQLQTVNTAECLNCQLCTTSCPVEGALENKWWKKRLSPLALLLLSLTLYAGGVGAAKMWDQFDFLPAEVTAETMLTADDIKGYMTLEEVALGTHIDMDTLYESLGLTDEVPGDTMMKNIKTIVPEFEVEAVRDVIRQLEP